MKTVQDIGLLRGGKNTKIHALVDGLGNPICLLFTGGEVHDSKEALPLLEGLELSGSEVLGNKAFGTIEILMFYAIADGIFAVLNRQALGIRSFLFPKPHLPFTQFPFFS